MNASNNPTLMHAKPEPRKRAKGRRRRAASAVVKTVRAQVKDRDGYCRLYGVQAPIAFGPCEGLSEWSHVGEKKRYRTRGLRDPRDRHATTHSLMLCKKHHGVYDANVFHIELLTPNGADSRLRFVRKDGIVWEETR